MTTTTARQRLLALHSGAALLLLAGPASAQVTEGLPPPEARTHPRCPPPTNRRSSQRHRRRNRCRARPRSPSEPPRSPSLRLRRRPWCSHHPRRPRPSGTADLADPNAPMLAPQTAAPPTLTQQPSAQVPASALLLTADRLLARPNQPITFTVTSADKNELPRNRIQLTITSNGKLPRRLRPQPDGSYQASLPAGSYQAQAVPQHSTLR